MSPVRTPTAPGLSSQSEPLRGSPRAARAGCARCRSRGSAAARRRRTAARLRASPFVRPKEPVEDRQERGERLAGPGGRDQQNVLARRDRRPGQSLRGGRSLGKSRLQTRRERDPKVTRVPGSCWRSRESVHASLLMPLPTSLPGELHDTEGRTVLSRPNAVRPGGRVPCKHALARFGKRCYHAPHRPEVIEFHKTE